jgi:hypothetical protein
LVILAMVWCGCVDLTRPAVVTEAARKDAGADFGAGGAPVTPTPAPDAQADAGSIPASPDGAASPDDVASPDDAVSEPDVGGVINEPDVGGVADTATAPPAPDAAVNDVPAAPDSMPAPEMNPAALPQGAACTSKASCASGNCVDGVCCATACDQACVTCNAAGAPGVCSPEPAGTTCAPASCSAGVASMPRRCDGAGTCAAAMTTSCGTYACYMTFCGSACLAPADCAAPYTCSANACVSPGLLLHWPLDEASGSTAMDASGNGRHGSLVGSGGSRPQPSSNAAPLTFANPRSLSFTAADNHGVSAMPIPASIKATANPELTMAAWFRASSSSTSGSDVIALGTDYALRMNIDKIECIRRTSTEEGRFYVVALAMTTAHLDGRWHHLAGTAGAAGMKLYLDGVQVASNTNSAPTIFVGPDQIGVGHQPSNDFHEFTGQIDDVRIYGRALTGAEIANLARGNR